MPQQTMPITFIKGDEIGAETDYRDALPVNMTAIARQNFGAHGYMLQSPGLTRVTNSSGERLAFPAGVQYGMRTLVLSLERLVMLVAGR